MKITEFARKVGVARSTALKMLRDVDGFEVLGGSTFVTRPGLELLYRLGVDDCSTEDEDCDK